jgi:hypothetical protein
LHRVAIEANKGISALSMSASWASFIGAFIRWVLKGFKTRLRDEIEGNFPAKWGGSYLFENYIIGIITVILILIVIIYGFFRE